MSEIQKLLDEPISRENVSTRSGGSGKSLSYLETWYVIDRLNQVLGTANWSNEIRELQLLPGNGKPSYRAIVRVLANIDGVVSMKDGVGFGSDKSDFNAHELAMKEAVSDALKVAAKNLGRSLGLALYDKTQEFVTDTPKETSPEAPAKAPTKSKVDPRAKIKAAFSLLKSQKLVTAESFRNKYLNGASSDDLDDAQALAAVAAITKDYSTLNL